MQQTLEQRAATALAEWDEQLAADLAAEDREQDREFARLFKTGSAKPELTPHYASNPADLNWDDESTPEKIDAAIADVHSDWQVVRHVRWELLPDGKHASTRGIVADQTSRIVRGKVQGGFSDGWKDRYKCWRFVETGECHVARIALPISEAAELPQPQPINYIPERLAYGVTDDEVRDYVGLIPESEYRLDCIMRRIADFVRESPLLAAVLASGV